VKLIDSFLISIRSLFSNKLRSSLTMLGIIIGVGAVVSLTSIGQGAEATISSTFQELGTNVLYVMPRSPEVAGLAGFSPAYSTPSLTIDDAKALERVHSVIAVAPVNENFIQVSARGESKTAVLHGATPAYLEAYSYTVASGQFISDRDVALRDTVVVLGNEVANDLFGASNPIGQAVKIKERRFTVIGVLAPKGGAVLGVSMDNVVVTPITTFQTRLFTERTASGQDAVQSISMKVDSSAVIDDVRYEAEVTLRKQHRLTANEKSDFAIVSQQQVLGIFSQITGVFTIFLGAIAGISLVVGGIGIMNIMLVSVTERTREIGIRKAVGAKRRDILIQFLIEAATLSFSGGAIGIIGGWLLSLLISQINVSGLQLHAVVSPDMVGLAVGVSVFIGLASGIYPAMRAARLNPIDALRYG
jgi:putative ABC transport system permease protein